MDGELDAIHEIRRVEDISLCLNLERDYTEIMQMLIEGGASFETSKGTKRLPSMSVQCQN